MALYKSVLIKDTNIDDRKDLLMYAFAITSIEYGHLDLSIFDDYISGDVELIQLKKILLQQLSEQATDGSTPLFENRLNIRKKIKLSYALQVIGIINIMILLTKELKYDYKTYKKIHYYIFGDIIIDAGKERDRPISKSIKNIKNGFFMFSSYKEIMEQMEEVIQKIKNFELSMIIDNNMKRYQNGWKEIDLSIKANFIADVISHLYYIHPFYVGDVTLSIFFVFHFMMFNRVDIDMECLIALDQLGGTENTLKEIIAISSFNYEVEKNVEVLTNIIRYALESQMNKEQEKVVEKESIKVQIQKAARELETKQYDLKEEDDFEYDED